MSCYGNAGFAGETSAALLGGRGPRLGSEGVAAADGGGHHDAGHAGAPGGEEPTDDEPARGGRKFEPKLSRRLEQALPLCNKLNGCSLCSMSTSGVSAHGLPHLRRPAGDDLRAREAGSVAIVWRMRRGPRGARLGHHQSRVRGVSAQGPHPVHAVGGVRAGVDAGLRRLEALEVAGDVLAGCGAVREGPRRRGLVRAAGRGPQAATRKDAQPAHR